MTRAVQNSTARRFKRPNFARIHWWRKLVLPRRGRKDSLLSPASLCTPAALRLRERAQQVYKSLLAPRASRTKLMVRADWNSATGLASVTTPKSNILQSMGFFADGVQMLYPEEALFLVDRGAMDLYFEGLCMSVQRTWVAATAASNALSMQEYLVFAALRRAGLVVRRYQAPDQNGNAKGIVLVDGETNARHVENVAADLSTTSCQLREEQQRNALAPRPTFSVWRVNSYRRRTEQVPPLFHLLVATPEQRPYTLSSLAALASSMDADHSFGQHARVKLRVAIVDRGVVMFDDVATIATPLSERFLRRLSAREAAAARSLRDGDPCAFLGQELMEGW